jgi:methylated-DNA-[protein]-cysteine S-methyltransferase
MQVRLKTAMGQVVLTFTSRGLARLEFTDAGQQGGGSQKGQVLGSEEAAEVQDVLRELEKYLAGEARDFQAIKLDVQGTPFQLKVWRELQKIPWGETVAYQDLAARLGNFRGSRAVGQALKANPIPIIIPCHRVVRRDGGLGGFSAGLERKQWLLRHEGRAAV